MNSRVEYEMSKTDLKKILENCKPVPCISFNGVNNAFSSPQENANRAWERLSKRMGFDAMTVRPSDKGSKFFTAIPSETLTQKSEREKTQKEEFKKAEIKRLELEIKDRQNNLDELTKEG